MLNIPQKNGYKSLSIPFTWRNAWSLWFISYFSYLQTKFWILCLNYPYVCYFGFFLFYKNRPGVPMFFLYVNPLSSRAFFGRFYWIFEFVTEFLRNGSTELQSFVYIL